MTDKRDLQALGEALAVRLFVAGYDPSSDGKPVSIPSNLLNEVVRLLLSLPGSRRGRPPKRSTETARLLAEVFSSKRMAARATSNLTGEPIDNLRRRLRPKKPSTPKKKGGT